MFASTTLPTGESESVTNDKLGRAVKYKTAIGTQELVYAQNGECTTNLIASETFRPLCHSEQSEESPMFSKVRYTYDKNGNITHIYEAGQLVCRYAYDELNRLISEDNAKLGRTYTYEYDVEGNLLYKNKYDFDLADNLTGGTLISYNYNKEGLLTDFNGEKCEYDVLGNPTLYRGVNFEFSHLRNLIDIDNGRINFAYNAQNLRTSKTCGNEVTKYHWLDGKLLAEVRSLKSSDNLHCGDIFSQSYVYAPIKTHHINYLYGVDGISGFVVNDVPYYYKKNILGDIVAVYDNECNLKAEYIYDAWGNHLVTVDVDGIGTLNPIRYRGYYYDVETGLYYLKSRYYDPETARFINMDDINMLDETKAQINGLNLYMYCGNNPITNIDESGFCFFCRLWKSIKKLYDSTIGKIIIGLVVIATLAILTVITAGAAGLSIGATFMGAITGSSVGGAAGFFAGMTIGAATASVVGFIGGGIISAIQGKGFISGASNGFMWGAIGGAFTGGVSSMSFSASTKFVLPSMLSAGIYGAQIAANGDRFTIWGLFSAVTGGIYGAQFNTFGASLAMMFGVEFGNAITEMLKIALNFPKKSAIV